MIAMQTKKARTVGRLLLASSVLFLCIVRPWIFYPVSPPPLAPPDKGGEMGEGSVVS
jgi:hypothetical protein